MNTTSNVVSEPESRRHVDDNERKAWDKIQDGYKYFITEIQEGRDGSSDDILVELRG